MEIEIFKMQYKKEKNINNLRIFGEEFIKNNRNKGLLIINNKKIKFPLKGIISLDEIKKSTIKMILTKYISNKSYLFNNCESLESISQLFFHDNEEIKDDNKDNNKYNKIIIDNKQTEIFNSIDNDFSYSGTYTYKESFGTISEITFNQKDILNNKFINLNEKYYILGGRYPDNKSSSYNISELNNIFITDMSYMFSNLIVNH